jgi:hypothetical protein
MRGVSKDDMSYSEGVWSLTLWEQIILARQNIYDGTWVSGDHTLMKCSFFSHNKRYRNLGEPRPLADCTSALLPVDCR